MVAIMPPATRPASFSLVREAARLPRRMAVPFIVDAVQAAGRVPLDINEIGAATSLISSSHKIGGPKGAGALVVAQGEVLMPKPLVHGGGQEKGHRSGDGEFAGRHRLRCRRGCGCRRTSAARNATAVRLRDRLENGMCAQRPMLQYSWRGLRAACRTRCFFTCAGPEG